MFIASAPDQEFRFNIREKVKILEKIVKIIV